jgi:Trk K+ transport system NAD-binding subunit
MSQIAIVAGPDPDGLGDALEAEGVTIHRITGVVSLSTLQEAGLDEADLLVLTDIGEASGIPVAKENTPEIRVVVYSPENLPDFVKGQADLAVDPELLDVSVVAEELAAEN